MPLIQVTLSTGRTPEQLAELARALTQATHEAIGAKPGSIRVIVRECEPEHWFVGGTSIAELRATGER